MLININNNNHNNCQSKAEIVNNYYNNNNHTYLHRQTAVKPKSLLSNRSKSDWKKKVARKVSRTKFSSEPRSIGWLKVNKKRAFKSSESFNSNTENFRDRTSKDYTIRIGRHPLHSYLKWQILSCLHGKLVLSAE